GLHYGTTEGRAPLALVRQRQALERPHVFLAHEVAAAVPRDARPLAERPAAHAHVAGARGGGDVADAVEVVLAVLEVWVHGDRDVRQQGPRRRRPHHELALGIGG